MKKKQIRVLGKTAVLLLLSAAVLFPAQAAEKAMISALLPIQREDTRGNTASLFEDDFSWALPQRWYAGNYGKKPVVRSQGKYGTCWALSAVSALESRLLPGKDIVFSADHLVLNNAFTIDVSKGGDPVMIMAYLSGWQGPVTEEEDPYGDGVSPDGLTPAVHVQEIRQLEQADTEQIKAALYQYGAVQTSLYMSRHTTASEMPYYNEMTSAYYYDQEEKQDHDILILGWDDHYSRMNFKRIPERDGAFICQNTWGEDFGDKGIFYVSYEDANIGSSCILYDRIEAVDNYSRIYQTDDCGWQGSQGYDNETCWFANVYCAEEDEMLWAYGFYATAPGAAYELYLVHDAQDEEAFDNRIYLQRGSMKNKGYYTIDLETPQQLYQGERFAVVVKITAPGRENPVAVEYASGEYTRNVTLEGKEGYLSQDGSRWQNTEKRFGTNVCLKAYTKEME